jgi:GntR family transcriptional regulator
MRRLCQVIRCANGTRCVDGRPAPDDAPVTPATGGPTPRYARIADALKAEIAAGTYQVGAKLPTEFELGSRYGVSRSTIRQALAELEAVGIARRRQGSGTTVVARAPALRYSMAVATEADIAQYASETTFEISDFALAVSSVDSRRLRLGAPDRWLAWRGLRRTIQDGPALGIGTVYVPHDYAGAMQDAGPGSHRAIFDRISAAFGVIVTSIEQQISATVLDDDEALQLETLVGAPALAIVRRYVADQQLIEVAETVFPSDRFSYTLRLDRDR